MECVLVWLTELIFASFYFGLPAWQSRLLHRHLCECVKCEFRKIYLLYKRHILIVHDIYVACLGDDEDDGYSPDGHEKLFK